MSRDSLNNGFSNYNAVNVLVKAGRHRIVQCSGLDYTVSSHKNPIYLLFSPILRFYCSYVYTTTMIMPLKFSFSLQWFSYFFILFPVRLKKGLNLTNFTFQSAAILNTYFLHYSTPVVFLQENILLYAIFSFMLSCFLHARSSVHFFFSENIVFTDFYRTAIALSRNF
jgi:hypothetical protein